MPIPKLKISDDNAQLVNQWSRFKNSKIWQEIARYLQEQADNADVITNTIGADSERLYTKRDIAILKKQLALDIIGTPDRMIAELAGTGELDTENFDPFEDTAFEQNGREPDDDI